MRQFGRRHLLRVVAGTLVGLAVPGRAMAAPATGSIFGWAWLDEVRKVIMSVREQDMAALGAIVAGTVGEDAAAICEAAMAAMQDYEPALTALIRQQREVIRSSNPYTAAAQSTNLTRVNTALIELVYGVQFSLIEAAHAARVGHGTAYLREVYETAERDHAYRAMERLYNVCAGSFDARPIRLT